MGDSRGRRKRDYGNDPKGDHASRRAMGEAEWIYTIPKHTRRGSTATLGNLTWQSGDTLYGWVHYHVMSGTLAF
jgi:hypothetical protein